MKLPHYHVMVHFMVDGDLRTELYHCDGYRRVRYLFRTFSEPTRILVRQVKRCNDPESVRHRRVLFTEAGEES